MRWYWAAAISLLVFYLAGAVTLFLSVGIPIGSGILDSALDSAWESLRLVIGDEPARYVLICVVATIPFASALGSYVFLRRGVVHGENHLRCLKCGYILKGLSEPRCPECGERI